MAELAGLNAEDSLAFLISAGLMYEAVAAACSSPQTTEINAKKRSGTLMKWVYLGLAQGALLVILGAMVSKKKGPILAGGAVSGGLLLAQYLHARKAGLESLEDGTED